MNDKRIFGYCRVSSEEQAAHGISVSAQRDILSGFAAMRQQSIEVFEDAGFSGKNTSRPALQRMLSACASGSADTVVVWKLDRLSRSLRDTLAIIEDIFLPAGISLVSVTESIDTSTPSGRMMLNMLASFAQLEREQDSDRVVMAHKHLARDCKYLGGHIPLGYRIDEDKHYQLDPITAPVIRRAFEMYIAREGYSAILDYLNVNLSLAKPMDKSRLNFMLNNEIYSGVFVRRMGADPRHRISAPETIRIPSGVPALLSPDQWRKVCAIRDQRKDVGTGAMHRGNYPLTGLVYCAVCGRLMPLNHGGKDRSGNIERYYTCKSRCVKPARLEKLQEAVFDALEAMAANEPQMARACAIANTYADGHDKDNFDEIRALESRLNDLIRQSAKLIGFIKKAGSDAPASILTELRSIDGEKETLQVRLEALRRPSPRYDVEATLSALRSVADIKKQPPAEQKAHVQTAVYRILVSQDAFQVILAWHLGGGDEPPHPICHVIKRS